jgi:hypothetical protein
MVENEDEEEFIRQLATYPDRVVGLLAPVLVENRIANAIRAHWQDDVKKEVLSDLFRDGGALGSFGIKVKIGFAIRLYGEDALHDLKILNTIRNDFAHRLSITDFENPSVKSRSNSLKLPAKYPVSPDSGTGVFQLPADSTMFDGYVGMAKHSMLGAPVNARTRFIRTVEIFTIFLSAEEYIASNSQIPADQLPTAPRF